MNSEFYNGIEKFFNISVDILNTYNQSEIIQDTIYTSFESNVYGTVIKNIFLNLIEENIIEYDISKDMLENFKSEFKYILDEVEKVLSYNEVKKIDATYYNNFKRNVEDKTPAFTKFINDFESELGLNKLNEYLVEKRRLMGNTGKNDSDYETIIATRIFEEELKKNGVLKPDFELSDDFHSKLTNEFLEKSMKITEWSIWHSYSTFFIENNYKLDDIAYKLVEYNVCPLVFSQDLKIWWKEEGQVKEDVLEILEYNTSGLKFQFPKISDNYILEGLIQFVDMWNAESNLLNDNYRNSFNYIRGFMNPCHFKSGKRPVALYPQLKLYTNGMFDLSFRQLSPVFEYLIDSFIEHEINLFRNEIDEIKIAPEIMKLSGRFSFYYYSSITLKLYNLINFTVFNAMDEDIEKRTEYVKKGDFSFYYTNVPIGEDKFNLDDIYKWFTSAISYVINTNQRYEFPTFNKLKYNLGNYWTLRPSVYITDFINQPYRSNNIHKDFGNELGKIMARTPNPFYMDFSKFLGENLREFEDYCLYMNNALTLWVFSKSGVNYNKNDPNLSFLYEKQVQIECIDSLNISLKRMSEISSNLSLSYRSVLTNQLSLDNLEEFFMGDISNFGEINKIFKYASKELKWDNLRELTKNKLMIRSQYSILKRDELYKKLAIVITIIFGLIGASTFFSNIIRYFGVNFNSILANKNLTIPILIIITLFIGWLIKSMQFKEK